MTKKAEKKVAPKKEVAKEEVKTVEPVNSNEPEPVIDGKGKAPDSIEGVGKFVVVAFKDGSRMYNELGQAVSPVETEAKEISKLSRQSARHNALVNSRTIKNPVGHEVK